MIYSVKVSYRRFLRHLIIFLFCGCFCNTPAVPEAVSHWSMTTLRDQLVKISAKIVRHGRSITFRMAEAMLPGTAESPARQQSPTDDAGGGRPPGTFPLQGLSGGA
jgi:hypothetical protein